MPMPTTGGAGGQLMHVGKRSISLTRVKKEKEKWGGKQP